MREQYEGFSKDMARLIVADVPEIRGEGDDFDSLHWEKPPVNDDFKLTTRTGEESDAQESTRLQAAHDGKSLLLRFRIEDSNVDGQNVLSPVAEKELWPKGDHVEFWLFGGSARYVFAFNGNGVQYDAKNLDRNWDSKWNLQVRRTETGWEAIAAFPLSTFEFVPGKATSFHWFCTREIRHAKDDSSDVSYQGKPLYYRNFPIVIE
jgi:hypothetical protein